MKEPVEITPISAEAFAPFGDVIDATGGPDKRINQGLCARFHDRARLEFHEGQAGVSLFHTELCSLPLELQMMERHPDGSQCFVPMDSVGFVVIVAEDFSGKPGRPMAFETRPGQAINIHRNVWHGVLTAPWGNGLFAVIDRIGDGPNLEEHWFEVAYLVTTSARDL